MTTYRAVNFTPGRIKPIRLIVIHTTQGQELKNQAKTVAAWFCDPKRAPIASAHFVVDNKNIIRILADLDTAWAAPNANADGLQLEIVGKAFQSLEAWSDAYSLAALDNAAQVCAKWVKIHNIKVRRLTKREILDRKTSGIVGHIDITRAFNNPGGHSDPGLNFPYNSFLSRVRGYLKS